MKKYQIIQSGDSDKLSVLIKEHLEKGWECQGGVAISEYIDKGLSGSGNYFDNSGVTYAQAIIKIDEHCA